jgi:diadenosine tetraphosphate (Ap4A) HIT family hydrolase
MFTLHPQLESDTLPILDLELSQVRFMNNSQFPWIVLVPRAENASEIIDLTADQRHLLMDEIAYVSQVLQAVFTPDKINVAALGNQVLQLHVHVIARYKKDAAWPNPVWGLGAVPYPDVAPIIRRLQQAFSRAPAF